MKRQRYRLGITWLEEGACFHQTTLHFGESGSQEEHLDKICVYGSEEGKKSSLKLAKKIVKLLNKDLDKADKLVNVKMPKDMLEQVGALGVNSEELVFDITDIGERSPASVTGNQYTQGIVFYRKEG